MRKGSIPDVMNASEQSKLLLFPTIYSVRTSYLMRRMDLPSIRILIQGIALTTFMGLYACSHDVISTIQPVGESRSESFHGYLYIGCSNPPYHLNLDSLIINCATPGLLPDTLPDLWTGANNIEHFCSYDLNRERFGNASGHDYRIEYLSYTVGIMATDLATVAEEIPLNFEGNLLSAGEHPYLGGRIFTSADHEAQLQVVNAYIGGCFHNVVVWQVQR